MKESAVWKNMLLAAGRIRSATVRIFRNNTAQGWAGKSVRVTPGSAGTIRLNPGDVVVRAARPLRAGLMEGSGDGIGWSTMTVTPEMVGRQIAVFTSAEAKSSTGRVSKEQRTWHHNVQAAGGISAIVRDPDDLKAAVDEFVKRGPYDE